MILKKKTSVRDIAKVLDCEEDVKQIVFSRGAYSHLPKRALAALKKMNIEIKIVDMKRGRKVTTNVEQIKLLTDEDLSPQDISKMTRIPLRTVYYHVRKIRHRFH
jgi:hypothetical protein